jgi:hypothetical protein
MTSKHLIRTALIALAALVVAMGAGDADAARKQQQAVPRSWASTPLAAVVRAGAFPGVPAASIDVDAPLDAPTLASLVQISFRTTTRRSRVSVRRSLRQIPTDRPITVGDVNRAFVTASGMDKTAARAEELVAAGGYVVRPGLGVEIVTRLLRLRTNLPQQDDAEEHAWYEGATIGDGAWTAHAALRWGGWERDAAAQTVELLAGVPQTTGVQHDAVQRAFDFIGMPYVWGGMTEKPQFLFGANVAGGFDCSGFTWRVLANDPTSPKEAAKAFGGRTTYEMARTATKAQRLPAEAIQPADIILFGPGGVNAKWGSVDHVGMAISPQLFIHASSQGVFLSRWDEGYYRDRTAFGKRILPF